MEILRHIAAENPKIHASHSQFIVDGNGNLQNLLNGNAIKLTQNQYQALEIYAARTGRILEPSDFRLLDSWYTKQKTLSILHSILVKELRQKMAHIGLADSNFPNGYLLTVPQRGTVLVDPRAPDHIATYTQFAVR